MKINLLVGNMQNNTFTGRKKKAVHQQSLMTMEEYNAWYEPYVRFLGEDLNAATSGNTALKKKRTLNRHVDNAKKNKFCSATFDSAMENSIKDSNSLFLEIKQLFGEISLYAFKNLRKNNLKGLMGSRVSRDSFNFVGQDDEVVNLFIRPEDNILKIMVKNKNNKVLRGYLLEESTKLVKNYNIKRPVSIPPAFIYANQKQIDEVATQLGTDLDWINKVLKQVVEIASSKIKPKL